MSGWGARAWDAVRGAPRRFAAGALLISLLAVLVVRSRHGLHGGVFGAPSEEDVPEDAPVIEWCSPGLEAIAGGGCYAAPAGAADGATLPLVLYLHGLIEKGPLEVEERDRQRRVALRATERGFAVLALRGAEGACTTDPEHSPLVCWPSNERTAEKAPAFVESWQPALRVARSRHPFDEKDVLGFSNGGFFAGLVAERALYDATAFVVAHGGPVEPVKAVGRKPPLLLISADEDSSQEGMVRLDDELTREDWPHAHYVRDGGHALPDSDIEAALSFFERTRTERLPLRPPLSTRLPRARTAHHETEAAAVDATPMATGAQASAPQGSGAPAIESTDAAPDPE